MPYVMIPAFTPSHQPLPVTQDPQIALPIQPIPCKPGELSPQGTWMPAGCPRPPTLPLFPAVDYPVQLLHSPPPPTLKRPSGSGHLQMQVWPQSASTAPKHPLFPCAWMCQGLYITPCLPSAPGDLTAAELDGQTQRLRAPQCLQLTQFEDEQLPVPHTEPWGCARPAEQPVQPALGWVPITSTCGGS